MHASSERCTTSAEPSGRQRGSASAAVSACIAAFCNVHAWQLGSSCLLQAIPAASACRFRLAAPALRTPGGRHFTRAAQTAAIFAPSFSRSLPQPAGIGRGPASALSRWVRERPDLRPCRRRCSGVRQTPSTGADRAACWPPASLPAPQSVTPTVGGSWGQLPAGWRAQVNAESQMEAPRPAPAQLKPHRRRRARRPPLPLSPPARRQRLPSCTCSAGPPAERHRHQRSAMGHQDAAVQPQGSPVPLLPVRTRGGDASSSAPSEPPSPALHDGCTLLLDGASQPGSSCSEGDCGSGGAACWLAQGASEQEQAENKRVGGQLRAALRWQLSCALQPVPRPRSCACLRACGTSSRLPHSPTVLYAAGAAQAGHRPVPGLCLHAGGGARCALRHCTP